MFLIMVCYVYVLFVDVIVVVVIFRLFYEILIFVVVIIGGKQQQPATSAHYPSADILVCPFVF